jgi:hypothetical protein
MEGGAGWQEVAWQVAPKPGWTESVKCCNDNVQYYQVKKQATSNKEVDGASAELMAEKGA